MPPPASGSSPPPPACATGACCPNADRTHSRYRSTESVVAGGGWGPASARPYAKRRRRLEMLTSCFATGWRPAFPKSPPPSHQFAADGVGPDRSRSCRCGSVKPSRWGEDPRRSRTATPRPPAGRSDPAAAAAQRRSCPTVVDRQSPLVSIVRRVPKPTGPQTLAHARPISIRAASASRCFPGDTSLNDEAAAVAGVTSPMCRKSVRSAFRAACSGRWSLGRSRRSGRCGQAEPPVDAG
jgi:hypothetical protein